MAEAFTIQPGLALAHRAAAAAIYWQAFGGKLAHVMGPEPLALRYLMLVMRGDHCFSAVDGQGQLLGIAGFKSPQGSFAGGGADELRAVYGRLGSRWRSLVLRLLSHEVDNERFLVDGIAVSADARSRGIGSALLQALYAEGRTRGYPAMRLEVVEGNWRAQALYRRQGFEVSHTERLGLLRYVFGFSAATTMIKPLDQPAAVAAPCLPD